MKLKLLFPILMLFWAYQASATKGCPVPFAYRQPDGTVIHISVNGDESFSYKTSKNGYLVSQGQDGFYYYVFNGGNSLCYSNIKVTDSGIGISRLVPSNQSVQKHFYKEGESFKRPCMTKGSSVMRTIVIPVAFPDLHFSISDVHSRIYNLFNQLNYNYDGSSGSVSDYFNDNLGHYGDFSFDIASVITVSKPYSYYGSNNGFIPDMNVRELVKEACTAAASSGVSFDRYDADGDGTVDNVIIFFAGYNESEGGGDDTIWPQSWNLEQPYQIGGKYISGFSCCSELSGADGCNFTGIGTICHEYCHFLGLQDMYDVNGSIDGLSTGLTGAISIMDYGNFNNNGKTPPYFNSIELSIATDMQIEELSIGSVVSMRPVYQSEKMYIVPTAKPGESFVVEYRDGSKWDSYIGGSGVLVYHIDRSKTLVGGISASERWDSNTINAVKDHPCLYLVSSAGQIATDASDCFFKSSDITSSKTFPLLMWNGKGIGVGFAGIDYTPEGMGFTVIADDSWEFPLLTDYVVRPRQNEAQLKWETDRDGISGCWTLTYGSAVSIERDTVDIVGKEFLIRDLTPGMVYQCKMVFRQGRVFGKEYEFDFQTIDKLSNLPLIAFMDAEYHSGDLLNLEIINIEEPIRGIEWYVNDKKISDNIYRFDFSGKFVIEARVTYEDGSIETLKKTLGVH